MNACKKCGHSIYFLSLSDKYFIITLAISVILEHPECAITCCVLCFCSAESHSGHRAIRTAVLQIGICVWSTLGARKGKTWMMMTVMMIRITIIWRSRAGLIWDVMGLSYGMWLCLSRLPTPTWKFFSRELVAFNELQPRLNDGNNNNNNSNKLEFGLFSYMEMALSETHSTPEETYAAWGVT